ncbi:DeoR/GlpR family DNA-binding transcription regulator [Lactococcus termiticola]|uniref:DeoR family transcriptional regulator n=1 Tax=Lactococcus termiticola TaxID=2169526 RepID=A0A2R5HGH6_9LACT|nr:DeoR/GlpR family DNA-binding transcription regulator [Lactococcus termiticola]GBG96956.1 DeoR family transcriptional regulator [Lactococcus termiticola]
MKAKRIEEIERFILEQGSVSYKELEEKFQVSMNTLRRDINELTLSGKIEKVYGGVKSLHNALLDYTFRNRIQADAKAQIGRLAASLIQEDDIIFIDSGTTTSQMLPYIDKTINCTILTNNLDVVDFFTQLPNFRLILIGAIYKHSTRSFVELSPSQDLTNININKAFMAATGVSLENGLSNSDSLEQRIKQNICQKSHEIYLLADHSKFDHTTLMTYAELDEIQAIITDQQPPQAYQDFFDEHGIGVLTAK